MPKPEKKYSVPPSTFMDRKISLNVANLFCDSLAAIWKNNGQKMALVGWTPAFRWKFKRVKLRSYTRFQQGLLQKPMRYSCKWSTN